jgi:carboxymethylenebutenolidase
MSIPDSNGRHPAVIVLPSVVGLNESYKNVTRNLAEAGIAGLAVDYYSREDKPPDLTEPEKLRAVMASLADQTVVADVLAALDFLADQPGIDSERIGTVGCCVGGSFSFLACCQTERLKACVAYYGPLKYVNLTENKPCSPIDYAANLRTPFLGHYGGADSLISLEDVAELDALLNGRGIASEVYVYPSCGHGFREDYPAPYRQPTPSRYRPVAAHEAWHRTMVFLNWYLRT